jgi:hypothetical protein
MLCPTITKVKLTGCSHVDSAEEMHYIRERVEKIAREVIDKSGVKLK